jgi:hypothetical protein
MATEVIATDQFTDWYRSLDDRDADAVEFSLGLLEQFGVTLGAPHSSKILGTDRSARAAHPVRGAPASGLLCFRSGAPSGAADGR